MLLAEAFDNMHLDVDLLPGPQFHEEDVVVHGADVFVLRTRGACGCVRACR